MGSPSRLALASVSVLGLLWACGGKQIGTADGGGVATEDSVASEDVIADARFETSTEDDSPSQDGSGTEDVDACSNGGDCGDSSTEDDSGADAGSEDASDANEGGLDSGGCVPGVGGIGVGSGGTCTTTLTETCGGASYSVKCSCPEATCACNETSGSISSGSTAHYDGCGSKCGDDKLGWTACGFPLP
jgi:hypothetical protein